MDKPSSPKLRLKLSVRQLATKLLPKLDGLKVDHISIDSSSADYLISLSLRMTSNKTKCPSCHMHSARIHSRYTRTLIDLPSSGFIVRLSLCVRKFFCPYPDCYRRIFTERLPGLAVSYARRTIRQADILRLIGLALGGRAGSRLLHRLQMPVSRNTILGSIRCSQEPEPRIIYSTPRVLGVDDFAFRKGITYGTILVDLEKHRPVEVLPSRKAEPLVKWLKAHPGIEIITRDRSGEYARAIAEGAPNAVQVADRFHLLCNIRDTLERVLDCNRSKLKDISLPTKARQAHGTLGTHGLNSVSATLTQRGPQVHQPEKLTSTEIVRQQESRERKQQLYQQVRELYSQGVQIKAIARQLKVSRMMIFRYVRLDASPTEFQRRPRPSMIDPYVPYLHQRWEDGCCNGGQLWRELQELGYPGSRKMLTVWVSQQLKEARTQSPYTPKKYRRQGNQQAEENLSAIPNAPGATCTSVESPKSPKPTTSSTSPTSSRLAWFLIRDPQSLDIAEQEVMAKLEQTCHEVITAYRLVHDFHRIVKGRLAEELDGWLKAATESGINAMRNFSLGIEKDKAAVLGALTYEWSQGQVEGQVNKLKLRKRQLYGRANFDLLRQFVLNHV